MQFYFMIFWVFFHLFDLDFNLVLLLLLQHLLHPVTEISVICEAPQAPVSMKGVLQIK